MEIRQAINLYLTAKAYNDTEFEKKFKNENKNLDECVTFVTYMVYKKVKDQAEKGKNSMAVAVPSDDEVFAYAGIVTIPWVSARPFFILANISAMRYNI